MKEDFYLASSFQASTIIPWAKLKELNPEAKVAPLYQSGLYKPYDYALTFGADYIHPYYMALDRTIVEESHRKNIKVNLWTVNDPQSGSLLQGPGRGWSHHGLP